MKKMLVLAIILLMGACGPAENKEQATATELQRPAVDEMEMVRITRITVTPGQTATATPTMRATARRTAKWVATYNITPSFTWTSTATRTPWPSSTSRPSSPAPDAVVVAEMLNMRSGPGTGYAALSSLQRGTALIVTGSSVDGSWIRVRSGSGEGWVSAGLCEINKNLSSVQVIEVAPPPTAPATETAIATTTPAVTETPMVTETPAVAETQQETATPAVDAVTQAPPEPTAIPHDYIAAGVWNCPGSTAGAAYVGSRKSDKFHSPSCYHVDKILPENRICFESRATAVNYGYGPCGTCRP